MPSHPNLLIITSDEMRGDCLGANGLNRDTRTPNLDAFAATGVLLGRHFCNFPKCVPSRISMHTGRYCHTDGYRTITQHLPNNVPDLLARCKDAGYDTALFGKNHLWEHFYGDNSPGSGYIHHHTWDDEYRRFVPAGWKNLKQASWRHPAFPDDPQRSMHYFGKGSCHVLDDVSVDQAQHFLASGRDRSKPFYLHVNLEAPHPGYGVEDPWYSLIDRRTLALFPGSLPRNASLPFRAMRQERCAEQDLENIQREIQAVYLGMIAKVDRQVASILAALEAQGVAKDTLVVFWADHGDFVGQYGLPEKWDSVFPDCLMHVPCILRGPGLPTGVRVDALTETVDLAPTLTRLLGLPGLPGVHGVDLGEEIAGRRRRTAVFADGGHEAEMRSRFATMPHAKRADGKQQTYARHPDSMARAKMVRSETWKLVVRETGDDELYDLTADPWELANVIGDPSHRDVVCGLQRELLAWGLRTDTDRPHQAEFGA